jgi:hypothetical protein
MKMKKFIAACVMTLIAAVVLGQDKPAAPVFASVSQDEVLLRYKHVKGQKVTASMDMFANMDITVGEQKIAMVMKMKMFAFYIVNDVLADGTAMVSLTITRITLDTTAPMEMSYDSDRKTDTDKKEFQSFGYMINTPIACRVTPLGEMDGLDVNPIIKKLTAAGEKKSVAEIEKQIKEMTKKSFIQLSKKPVKAGDVYDAGTLAQDAGNFGTSEMSVQYRIKAVSGDKKKALLEPVVSFKISGLNIKKSTMNGWILFDLEKGNIEKSFGDVYMEIAMSQGGQSISAIYDIIVNYAAAF